MAGVPINGGRINRHLQLTRVIAALNMELEHLTNVFAPTLLQTLGIGVDMAAALLVTVGSNHDRLKSGVAFAALCGVSPIPASSGKTNRFRLNSSGDRQAKAAIYRIALISLRYDDRLAAYFQRRIKDGKTKAEAIRCLKRYVAREVFAILHDIDQKTQE